MRFPVGSPSSGGSTTTTSLLPHFLATLPEEIRLRGPKLDLSGEAPDAAFIPLRYDHERLADEMRAEGIAEPFVKTVETGWWTTCLEILPSRERARGMY